MAADVTRKRKREPVSNFEENGDETMDEEPNFSDAEDFVDNVNDKELMPDILNQRPKETDGIDSVIVVDNIPKVGPERAEKLKNVVRKIYSKFGKIVNEFYPEENGLTKGYMFLEFSSPANAKEAVNITNGHKLDKQHTFKVNLFSDFDKYLSMDEKWETPVASPYNDHGNLRSWLMNEDCQDQYSVIYEGGDRTAIYWNSSNEPIIKEERSRWTETYVRWSPQGTYLTTLHTRGIALWGGEKFGQIMKFSHYGVQLIDFSPCERYLISFSPLPDHCDEPQAIIMWDLRTGQKKRGFHCDNAPMWPVFKWSRDGKYVARMTTDTLSVYETPTFGLLDKKSIKINGIKDFTWSPTDNTLVYWVPEGDNVPARVTIIEIPSRIELCSKNLFHVVDCKMHWQKNGDFLCVKVDRYTKKKETTDAGVKYIGIYHHFELFRMREKQIPVDQVEIKEPVTAFAWEPNGNKFGFIHGESTRISVTFYVIRPAGGKVEIIKTLERRTANSIFWSPQGTFIVLAGLRGMNGVLEFIDTSDMTIMNSTEHFMANTVEWDSTGRYIATAVSWWDHKMDNAYWIWTFQGRLLQKNALDRFCQFLWRPRPPSLLTPEMVKDVKKSIKKYSVRYEMKDRMMQSKVSKDLLEKRQRLMNEFSTYRKDMEEEFRKEKAMRLELRRGIDTDELDNHVENFEEETFELLVSTDELILEE